VSNWYDRVQELTENRIPVATVTIVRGTGLGGKLVITDDSIDGSLGDAGLNDAAVTAARAALESGKSGITPIQDGVDAFIEVIPVPPRLIIFGGVHVAQALVPIARSVGFDIVVTDARQQLATPERFPDVDQLLVVWPDEALSRLKITKTTAIAILTHDPKFDEPALLGALKTDAMYIGAVGSRKTNVDRRERLLAAGVSEAQVARIHGPIGLDIGGRSPEEMAISILAEIIAVRNGRTGAALATTSGSIRAE
jgi:xanthine dehydrogenase accessory factor